MSDPLVELAERVLAACSAHRLTLATAESCTGGLVAHLITEVPGASLVLRGGLVAYADDVKRDALEVPADVLAAHGAVSAQVALALAGGVRRVLRTDLGVAVTGIAGPDGGTREKPVGLVYVAVAGPGGSEVERHQWPGDRSSNKRDSARAALELVERYLAQLGSGSPSEATAAADDDPAPASASDGR